MRQKWTQDELDILEQYYGTIPIRSIIDQFLPDRSRSTVKHKARSLGLCGNRIEMLRMAKTKHIGDSSFFTGNTLDVFYWAGFIAADGCITQDGRLQLGVANKDLKHLCRFMRAIKYSGPITETHNGRFHMIRVRNDSLVRDLRERFNIIPRKTLKLQPPTCFETHGQEIAFAVGYIDGDGCIHQNKHGRFELSCLGTLSMTRWIRGVFFPQLDTNISKRNRIYCFKITGQAVIDVIDCVKNMSLPLLKRKWYRS